VAIKHVFRNSLIAVAAAFGFTFAALISAVVTERLFFRQDRTVQSILLKDYPVIPRHHGHRCAVSGGQFVMDLAYAWLDPRVSLK
jgi:peptide/nickel transport system permease protein